MVQFEAAADDLPFRYVKGRSSLYLYRENVRTPSKATSSSSPPSDRPSVQTPQPGLHRNSAYTAIYPIPPHPTPSHHIKMSSET
ncbi:hypothetical protein BV898_18122 [Hypsibius exemplaris]|uniref:Uncharacterized protein n=1 Tax=Hypsibius exemplaris TaxID=2072580 RepID=A0A9X6NG99_HYPEX|nr:hypothetical protein BV898_18122 [Hypsibius exemplaris]